MSIHLDLDLDNSRHRLALQALLASFGTEAPAAGAAVSHVAPEPAKETPTPAPGAEGADTDQEAPQSTVTPPPVSPPQNSAPEASASGSEDFPGKTEWANLDKAGTPYNDSIHTGTQTLNQDGTWRYKRGTDRAEAEALEARLRAAAGGEAAPEPEQSSPANPGFGKTPAAGSMFEQTPAGATVAPPAGEPPKVDFQLLMRRIHSEGVSIEQRDAALTAVGLQSLPQLSTLPEMVPSVYAQLFPNG